MLMRSLVGRRLHRLLPVLLARTAASAWCTVLTLALMLCAATSVFAATDLSDVGLKRTDFPSGFRAVPRETLADAGIRSDKLGESLAAYFDQASMSCFSVFANREGSELVESFVIGPMTNAEIRGFDSDIRNRKDFREMMAEGTTPYYGDADPPRDLPTGGVGDSSAGLSMRLHADGETAWLGTALGGKSSEAQQQLVAGRRGQYILMAFSIHVGADRPRADLVRLAGILEGRLARAQGLGGASEFVASVPLPTQVSRDPAVIGTNVVLALILALGFGLTSTLFNSTLKENNATLRRWVDPALRPFSAAARRLKLGVAAEAAPHSRARRLIEPLSIVAVAALIYSFLDPGFSISTQGLQLFLSLLVSVAVVTYLYEGVQARMCRTRFQTPAALKLYPAALLVAVGCVVASRVAGFSPGYLYGFVGAMAFLTAAKPSVACRGRMVLIASVSLLALSVGVWFLAVPLSAAAEGGGWLLQLLQGTAVAIFVAGLESVFFGLIPLNFMDGETLLRWRKVIWLVLFATVGFMFWHVLLNKDSQYGAAFAGQSTRVMLTLLAVFTGLTLVTYFYFRSRRPHGAPVTAMAGSVAVAGAGGTTTAAAVQTVATTTLGEKPAETSVEPAGPVPIEGTKTCPACGATIRAAARLCRYCRAGFELTYSGDCPGCRGIVQTGGDGVCGSCGAQTLARRVETVWVQESVAPAVVNQTRVAPVVASVSTAPAAESAGTRVPPTPAPRRGKRVTRRVAGPGLPLAGVRARGQPLRAPQLIALSAGLLGMVAGCGLIWAWSMPWYEAGQRYVLFYENPPTIAGCGVLVILVSLVAAICCRRRWAVLTLGLVTIVLGALAGYVTWSGRVPLEDAGVAVGGAYTLALAIGGGIAAAGLLACIAAALRPWPRKVRR